MPVRYRRSTRPLRSNRRKSIWATSLTSNLSLAAGTTITPIDLLSGLEAGGVGIVGGTVTRCHLALSLEAADTDANPSFIWGMTMWDKSSIGVTNPNVTSDFYIDWLMLRIITPGMAANTTVAPPNAPTEWLYGEEYDIKSRRRIHEMHDSLFFLLGNEGTVAASYTIFARTLVTLP